MMGVGRRQVAAMTMDSNMVLSPISAMETRPVEIRKASKKEPVCAGASADGPVAFAAGPRVDIPAKAAGLAVIPTQKAWTVPAPSSPGEEVC
ncbi:hypothetical protein GCM10017620_22700 [Brevundimonas intermedia]|uniref:Uncharacterized protein n=1 Tax=Brevundimonas intermedia TaxID=74315 RepID=A0ABQ5T941_9CAUL|nr:hypothetical protein GCM10017620_22700 [Brevundimonas intermedia]